MSLTMGDKVRLKSGGPDMTVNQLDKAGFGVECIWFDGAKRCNAFFSEAALEPISSPPPPRLVNP